MKKFKQIVLLVVLVLSAFITSVPVKAQDKITVYMPSPASLAEDLVAAFTEETGIEVDLFQGTTGEITARLEAEASNPIADVVVLASWTDGLTLKNQDLLANYELSVKDQVHPDWIDEDQTLFGYSASAVGVVHNTDILPELSADWPDFLGEEFTDELAIPDPEKSGSAKDFVSAFVEANGWEIFEGMSENGLIVPGANSAALESVMVGEVGVLIGGVDYNAYKSMEDGEPINIYYPAGGTVVNPRPAMIMNTAPNPEGAQQFMEFLFSDAAQQRIVEAYLLPGRSDIEVTNRASLDEIPQIETNWESMMTHADEDAAKINELAN